MNQLSKLSGKAWIGIGFIYVAGLGWLMCMVLPFLNVRDKATTIVGVFAIAEVSFLIGIALLGKAYYRQLKDRLMQLLRDRSK